MVRASWESLLPAEVLRLPRDLARVDALLDDPSLPDLPRFLPVSQVAGEAGGIHPAQAAARQEHPASAAAPPGGLAAAPGLLDELDLQVFPVVAGQGKRLSGGDVGKAGLTLAICEAFPACVAHLAYRPAST